MYNSIVRSATSPVARNNSLVPRHTHDVEPAAQRFSIVPPPTSSLSGGRYPRTGLHALHIHVELPVFAQSSCWAIELAMGCGL